MNPHSIGNTHPVTGAHVKCAMASGGLFTIEGSRTSGVGSTTVARSQPGRIVGSPSRLGGGDAGFLAMGALWALALVAFMPSSWDTGLGAVPLVEDRLAIFVLTILAFGLGVLARRWDWPVVVACLWIALVGATQVWLLERLGEVPYLMRWRQVAPTYNDASFMGSGLSRFSMADLIILVLAGAALPGLGAALGVVVGQGNHPQPPGRIAQTIVAINVGLGIVGLAVLYPGGLVIASPIAFFLAIAAGWRLKQWDWVIAGPLAFAGGALGWQAIRLQWFGIQREWQNLIHSSDFLRRSSFADTVPILLVSLFVLLPASILATAVKRRRSQAELHFDSTRINGLDEIEAIWPTHLQPQITLNDDAPAIGNANDKGSVKAR